MQIFIRSLTGNTITVQVEADQNVWSLKEQISAETGAPESDIVLTFGLSHLRDEETLGESGLEEESVVAMSLRLAGGKKKRKKKVYTKPKKIKHKHTTKKMYILDYFKVEASGKVTRLRQESQHQAGCYLADHKDRMHCGKTGFMVYKLTKDGQRIQPVQNKPKRSQEKVEKADAGKKAGGKKKK